MQVRAAREARGWSQEHLAAASGVGLRTVQRAEAGSRISPENTLALCATLEIEPSGLRRGAPSTDAGTLPHLRVLRAELDRALEEFGERPLWQKADASPAVSAALARMGLAPDGEGFAEAQRRVLRHDGNLRFAQEVLQPVAFAWVIGLLGLPSALMALHGDFTARWHVLVPLILLWALASVPLLAFALRQEKAWARIRPTTTAEAQAATIVLSDLFPIEAALTRDYLWIAESGPRGARVLRIGLSTIEAVDLVRSVDGYHSARFRIRGLLDGDGSTRAFKLTRLRDDEMRWLDRRFGTIGGAVVWSPAMA